MTLGKSIQVQNIIQGRCFSLICQAHESTHFNIAGFSNSCWAARAIASDKMYVKRTELYPVQIYPIVTRIDHN